MELLLTFCSLLAIFCWILFFLTVCRVPAALSPLLVLCCTVLWFSAAGCLDVLRVAGYLYFGAAIAAGIFLFAGPKRPSRDVLHPVLLSFFVGSLLLLCLFAARQPLYTSWDDFSFWGTAAKLTSLSDRLFTVDEIGWTWPATQKPGLIVLSYFFNFFGSYAPWRAIYAYDLLLLAAFCAIGSAVKKEQWNLFFPSLLLCVLIPYVLVLYRPLQYPADVYRSLLSDIPMGVLFGAVFLVGFALSRDGHSPLWTLPVLAVLVYVRDTALPPALIAAVTLALQHLLLDRHLRLGTRIRNALLLLAVPVAAFFSWTFYLQTVLQVDPMGNLGGTGTISTTEMLTQGVLQLFGVGTTEKFSSILQKMVLYYWQPRTTMLGSGLRVTLVILAVLGAAWLFSADKTHRRRCVLFTVLSSLGFLGFFLFTDFCFAFIFKEDVYTTLIGYERYLYPYYIGWLLASLWLLADCAGGSRRLLRSAPALVLFGMTALFGWLVSTVLLPGYSVLDYNSTALHDHTAIQQKADSVQRLIDGDTDPIYFLCAGDNGGLWFEYSCALLPCQLTYGNGSGTPAPKVDADEDDPAYGPAVREWMLSQLQQADCAYVLVIRTDEALLRDYGPLFSDGLQMCADGRSALYRVEPDGNTPLRLLGPVTDAWEEAAP